MYQELFLKLGLSANEALLYEYFLKHGEAPAGLLIQKTPLKRGLVYKVLGDLVTKGLLSEGSKGSVKLFIPQHPEKLKEFVADREKQLLRAGHELDSQLAALVSDFQLVSGRPGVRTFEGLDGVQTVLDDTLTSATEILTIADSEAIDKYFAKINRRYVAKRNKLGKKKRLLVVDSPYSRKHFAEMTSNIPGITDIKFIAIKIKPFNTTIQIYDKKIAYITMTDDYIISTIINDPYIYSLHKALFEFIWNQN